MLDALASGIAQSVESADQTFDETLTRFGIEQFLADSFLHLALDEVKGELRRTLTVRKMRFTRHDTGRHPVHITADGLVVAEERVP